MTGSNPLEISGVLGTQNSVQSIECKVYTGVTYISVLAHGSRGGQKLLIALLTVHAIRENVAKFAALP